MDFATVFFFSPLSRSPDNNLLEHHDTSFMRRSKDDEPKSKRRSSRSSSLSSSPSNSSNSILIHSSSSPLSHSTSIPSHSASSPLVTPIGSPTNPCLASSPLNSFSSLDAVENFFSQFDEEKRMSLLTQLISKQNLENQWKLVCSIENMLKKNPMDIIPPELGIYIFMYLNVKDLAKAAQVCKQWNDLATDRTLTKNNLRKDSVYCLNCKLFFAKEEEIINRKYRLDYSLAFHFKTLNNVEISNTEQDVTFSSGTFKVAKACCRKCKTEVGIKYLNTNEENEYKKNSFLVKKKLLYFPGEPQHSFELVCLHCKTLVAKEYDIINWNQRLNGNEAYQVATMKNVRIGNNQSVNYTSGQYSVAECTCEECEEPLGVKYMEASSAQNAYKIGTYLIERTKLKLVTTMIEDEDNNNLSGNKKKSRRRRGSFLSSVLSYIRRE